MRSAKIKTVQPAEFQRALLGWYDANKRDLPWRGIQNPYATFVSEMMLQQTQVKTVIPYFHRFLKELPDWKALAKAKPEKVLKLWAGLGYYRRARNLQAAALQQKLCQTSPELVRAGASGRRFRRDIRHLAGNAA